MFKFLKSKSFFLKRSFSTNENSLLAQCIKERTLLRLSGNDAGTYLQGLITNDMKHLQDGATSMFALFLNSSGRVLFDSIIYHSKKDDIFYIECDSEASSFLQSHIKKYKVRRKVSVDSVNDEFDVWTVVNSLGCEKPDEMFDYKKLNNVISKTLPDIFTANDPRLPCLGLRILTPKNYNLVKEVENMTDLKMQADEFYKRLRYKLGVGEGMNELPSEKCFPMEINGDYLHGISFHKGCYIGQELTARVYHTGVIRKRIMPLVFDEEVNSNENGIPIFAVPESSKPVGKLQGVEKTNGVGLLRIEEVLKAENLMVLEKKCRTFSPFWWPCEAPKGRMNVG